jgi:hypothetical protein
VPPHVPLSAHARPGALPVLAPVLCACSPRCPHTLASLLGALIFEARARHAVPSTNDTCCAKRPSCGGSPRKGALAKQAATGGGGCAALPRADLLAVESQTDTVLRELRLANRSASSAGSTVTSPRIGDPAGVGETGLATAANIGGLVCLMFERCCKPKRFGRSRGAAVREGLDPGARDRARTPHPLPARPKRSLGLKPAAASPGRGGQSPTERRPEWPRRRWTRTSVSTYPRTRWTGWCARAAPGSRKPTLRMASLAWSSTSDGSVPP